jgi:tRNA A-37 threonylcarbamoyl transferase component Bud32
MAAAGLDIDINKLLASGQVIKDDTATTVVRTRWSGRDVVIKRYNYRGFLRALADVVRGSRARRAWRNGLLLKHIGVASPEPLKFIEIKKFGFVRESFLITPCIEGANFHHYIRNENLPLEQKRRVVEQIKNMLDTLALHKISHGDTKASNFLVAGEGPVITDLDSMKIHWTASMARRGAENDLTKFITRINTDDISADIRQLCTAVFGYNGPVPYQLANDYVETAAERNNGWNMLIRRGFNHEYASAIVSGGVCRDEGRYARFRSSKMARVWTTTVSFKNRDILIFIKEHLHRSIIDFVKHLFRDSRARRAFMASLMLRRNGFGCPEPLILLEKYRRPFRSASFAKLRICTDSVLVTEGIKDCTKLLRYFKQLAAEGTESAAKEKRTIIHELGSYIGKMHKLGISHGDLRTGNILLQKNNEQWRFYLIDNERTRQFTLIPRELIIKNLIQLNMLQTEISNSDRVRFLKAYNEQMQFTDGAIRRLCEQIIHKTDRRLKIRAIHHSS